jgi:DNA-binding XRE family transcriptional regulator
MSAKDAYTPFNDELDEIINATPERAAAVAEIHAEIDDADRAYRMNLAALRSAAHYTQEEIAQRLGMSQSAVSRAEKRGDMLYSTLLSYLRAAGAEDPTLVVTMHGKRIEIDLATAAEHETPAA